MGSFQACWARDFRTLLSQHLVEVGKGGEQHGVAGWPILIFFTNLEGHLVSSKNVLDVLTKYLDPEKETKKGRVVCLSFSQTLYSTDGTNATPDVNLASARADEST